MSGTRTVLLKDICNFEKGSTGLMKAEPGEYPLVTTGKDNRTCASYQFDTKAVCIPLVSSTGHGHASLNNVHYQEGKFALGTILVAITAKNEKELDVHFLHLYLSQLKDIVLVPLMKGAANVSLSITAIKGIEVPLPCIASQKKIVEKFKSIVEEEYALIDELRTQSILLKKLRRAVLIDAASGKLTKDWRNKEVARDSSKVLLELIIQAKQKLSPSKPLEKLTSPISVEKENIHLPDGWEMTSLANCSINKDELRRPVTKSDRDSKEKLYDYYGASGVIDKIDSFTHEGEHLLIGEDGANLIARSTPIAFIANDKFWVNNHAHVIATVHPITLRYLEIYINSIDLNPYISGGFQPKLSQKNLNSIPIAFPSLEEQELIVKKVNTLRLICEKLEECISSNHSNAKMLMNSVLMESFTGAN
jgi:type I restriction enzyme S subunit